MMGVWIVNFLAQIKATDTSHAFPKKKYSLIEFGPGRGTLMADILRVTS